MLLSRNSARLSRKRAPLLAPAVVRFRGACVERPPSRACAARVLFLEADDERRCCSPRSFARVLFLVAGRRVACVRLSASAAGRSCASRQRGPASGLCFGSRTLAACCCFGSSLTFFEGRRAHCIFSVRIPAWLVCASPAGTRFVGVVCYLCRRRLLAFCVSSSATRVDRNGGGCGPPLSPGALAVFVVLRVARRKGRAVGVGQASRGVECWGPLVSCVCACLCVRARTLVGDGRSRRAPDSL